MNGLNDEEEGEAVGKQLAQVWCSSSSAAAQAPASPTVTHWWLLATLMATSTGEPLGAELAIGHPGKAKEAGRQEGSLKGQ